MYITRLLSIESSPSLLLFLLPFQLMYPPAGLERRSAVGVDVTPGLIFILARTKNTTAQKVALVRKQ